MSTEFFINHLRNVDRKPARTLPWCPPTHTVVTGAHLYSKDPDLKRRAHSYKIRRLAVVVVDITRDVGQLHAGVPALRQPAAVRAQRREPRLRLPQHRLPQVRERARGKSSSYCAFNFPTLQQQPRLHTRRPAPVPSGCVTDGIFPTERESCQRIEQHDARRSAASHPNPNNTVRSAMPIACSPRLPIACSSLPHRDCAALLYRFSSTRRSCPVDPSRAGSTTARRRWTTSRRR